MTGRRRAVVCDDTRQKKLSATDIMLDALDWALAAAFGLEPALARRQHVAARPAKCN